VDVSVHVYVRAEDAMGGVNKNGKGREKGRWKKENVSGKKKVEKRKKESGKKKKRLEREREEGRENGNGDKIFSMLCFVGTQATCIHTSALYPQHFSESPMAHPVEHSLTSNTAGQSCTVPHLPLHPSTTQEAA